MIVSKTIEASFGNQWRIITERGAAFTGNIFKDYYVIEGMEHLVIATGVTRNIGKV